MSKIGMGTWQLGGANFQNGKPTGWGNIDKTDAVNTVRLAYSKGITFFDTADTYGAGLSEKTLGEALQIFDRNSFKLCTKFGNIVSPDGVSQDFGSEWLHTALEKSLQNLQTDFVDILLLHSPPDDFDWKNYDKEPFENLIKIGKIKNYGVSSKSVFGAKKVMDANFGSWIEATYNCLDRRAEDVIFSHQNSSNYQFISRVPLASGFLNDKYLKEEPVFTNDDYRSCMNNEDKNWLLENVRNLNFLNTNTESLTENAIKFCMSHPKVSYVIPGMRSESQVDFFSKINPHSSLPTELIEKIKTTVPDVPDRWKPKVI
ncbi:MAG: aldo/keto reductase [Pseudarcicella sp.]|nr:aldo/keto reductase [Pseudarcicella sp.]MBP6411001.1 aldo/keto reductase [Pseudarcicella sp.]